MGRKKGTKKGAPPTRRAGPVPFEVRVRIVGEVLRGANQHDVALAFGVSTAAVQKYLGLYRHGGMEALRPRLTGAAATSRARAGKDARRNSVVELRQEHPEWGSRRIRDVLARFAGLGVSETEVRRILHEAGLMPEAPRTPARPARERRFERAEPNQLWQSDIFTFLLRRHERLYVAAFLDDHARYVVSYAMAHHQKSSLVLEALERGIATYGTPREVLTDQGRQYTAWRGETEFEQLLRQYGVRHTKSRPQHPQTLGKIERFWKTLWDEFLSRTVFADFADCDRRLALYVQHYNFQRPHQALEGLVPADRFFRAAPHVRAAVEATVAANALRLAQQQPPRKPFYLVGRLGDQDLSIAAAAGGLTVQVGDAAQTIALPKEDDDGAQATRAFRTDESRARATAAADAAVADGAYGPGPGGAAAVLDGAVGAVGRAAGDDGDRDAEDFSWDVLPAGDQGAGGDAGGAGAWRGRRDDARWGEHDAADGGAGEQGGEAGAGQAAPGAAAVPGAQAGPGRAGDDGTGAAGAGSEGPELDEQWAQTFAFLATDDDHGSERDDVAGGEFDPDAGWRDDAVTWTRKLAGERGAHGAQASTARAIELSAGTDSAAGGVGALRGDHGGAGRDAVDERGGAACGHRAPELSDAGAPSQGGAAGDHGAAAERTDPDAVARGRAGAAREAAGAGQSPAGAAAGHDGPAAGCGRGSDHGATAPVTPTWACAAERSDAAGDERGSGRGPGTSGAADEGGGDV